MNRALSKVLAENRKAHYNYFVDGSLECGLVLQGTEVKSMKMAQFSFNDAWVEIDKRQLFVHNLHINPYKMAAQFNHDPNRRKKLLAHREEICKLQRKTEEKGYTLIPLKFSLRNGLIKVEVGLCKGKKQYDKRESIKLKDQKREMDREYR